MSLLLDTHALFWWLTDDSHLSPSARKEIAHPQARVFVSAASIWEMAIKARIGKWPEVLPFLACFEEALAVERFELLAIEAHHAREAGLLDWDHQDPFDRMLVAQARLKTLTLISADRLFRGVPVDLLW